MSESTNTPPLPPSPRFNVTAADFAAYPWQAVIENCTTREIPAYFDAFRLKVAESQSANDARGIAVYHVLAMLASLWNDTDATGNPFKRMSAGWGSPDEMSPDCFTALEMILADIRDHEFRARVSDVLWSYRNRHKAAREAITAYLKSAQALKTPDDWVSYTERLWRAAELSSRRGFETLKAEVVKWTKECFEAERSGAIGFGALRLLELLFKFSDEPPDHYASAAEEMAKKAEDARQFSTAEEYWSCAARWHWRARRPADTSRCRVNAAEALVSAAELSASNGGPDIGDWVLMGRGLEALRQASASPARVESVHRRLIEFQAAAAEKMQPIEANVDEIPGFRENEAAAQEQAAQHVSGHPLPVAVGRLVHVLKPTDVGQLRKQLDEISKETVFDKIVTTYRLGQGGKLADTLDPSKDPTEDEELKRMFSLAGETIWPIAVRWLIEPARIALVAEHPVQLRDMRFLTQTNPFIRPGHELIYARGIHAGFHGDWLLAMHVLIPQIEASLRHILQQHGVVTSKLESDGIQDERDINKLLWEPKLSQILGDDVLFDLRGILINRFGHNMRNEMSHGLMSAASFSQEASVYLWWLVLRLCYRGYTLLSGDRPKTRAVS